MNDASFVLSRLAFYTRMQCIVQTESTVPSAG